ncbi:uncharacterized protein LOC119108156 [Pollicipes pollicipes]|uniref:uncharacterized protein LOC119108156 n=1 Tax=Pollicipes pollicipes TaxID=41117 RepID=UPI001884B227|nr:uncharacterized protein LOC119108156 [Pollicipes pollicipes]
MESLPAPEPASQPAGPAATSDQVKALLRSRRREKRPEEWKRHQRKNRRIAGKEYVNTKGELVQPKQMGDACNCRMKCFNRVDQATREGIFNGFYSLKSYDEQNAYLFGLIRKKEIARISDSSSERRTCSYQYFVRCKGREILVCKLAFANIHAITFKKIRMLSEKLDQNVMYPRDQRGKHMNRPSKISEEVKDQARKHIAEILKSSELRRFLKEDKVFGLDLNLAKMHKDYLKRFEPMAFQDHLQEKLRLGYQPQLKIWLYSNIYHTEFRFANLEALRTAQQPDRRTVAGAAVGAVTDGGRVGVCGGASAGRAGRVPPADPLAQEATPAGPLPDGRRAAAAGAVPTAAAAGPTVPLGVPEYDGDVHLVASAAGGGGGDLYDWQLATE